MWTLHFGPKRFMSLDGFAGILLLFAVIGCLLVVQESRLEDHNSENLDTPDQSESVKNAECMAVFVVFLLYVFYHRWTYQKQKRPSDSRF